MAQAVVRDQAPGPIVNRLPAELRSTREGLIACAVLGVVGILIAVVGSQCDRRAGGSPGYIMGGSCMAVGAALLAFSEWKKTARYRAVLQGPQALAEGAPLPDARIVAEVERLRGEVRWLSQQHEQMHVNDRKQRVMGQIALLKGQMQADQATRLYPEDADNGDLVAHLVPMARLCVDLDAQVGGSGNRRMALSRRQDYVNLRECIRWDKRLLKPQLEGCRVDLQASLDVQLAQAEAYVQHRPESVTVADADRLLQTIRAEHAAEQIFSEETARQR